MAVTIISEPLPLSLTGNKIAYHLQSDLGTGATIVLQVFVETSFGSGVYKEVPQLHKPVDENGEVVFELQPLIRPYLEYEFVDYDADTAIFSAQVCKAYYVAFADTDQVNVCSLELNATKAKYALRGGLSFSQYPTLRAMIGNAISLLTTRPYSRLQISRKQRAFLSFIREITIVNLSFDWTVHYTDGNTKTITVNVGTVPAFQVVHIPYGFNVNDYEEAGKKISHITTDLFGYSVRVEVFDTSLFRQAEEVHWYNSLGGLDSLIATGVHEQEDILSREEFRHHVAYDYQMPEVQFENYDLEARTGGVIRSGYKDKAEYQVLLDLMRSQHVVLRVRNLFRNILMTADKIQRYKSDQYLNGLAVPYRFAYPAGNEGLGNLEYDQDSFSGGGLVDEDIIVQYSDSTNNTLSKVTISTDIGIGVLVAGNQTQVTQVNTKVYDVTAVPQDITILITPPTEESIGSITYDNVSQTLPADTSIPFFITYPLGVGNSFTIEIDLL